MTGSQLRSVVGHSRCIGKRPAAVQRKSSTRINSSIAESTREKNMVRPSRVALMPNAIVPKLVATVTDLDVAKSK